MNSEIVIVSIEIFVFLLSLAVIVGITARRLRIPYTVGLVFVGIFLFLFANLLPTAGLEYLPEEIFLLLDQLTHIDDETMRALILGLLVPPLIFEAAFHLKFKELRENYIPISLFAIPGVIITTLLVGWSVYFVTELSFNQAVVFGALIAATDPVAVVALFRSFGVPNRLQVLLEGESLLNDGLAIVLFGIAVEILDGTQSFSLGPSILQFMIVSGGGLGVGVLIGGAISRMLHRLDDYLIETALTFVAGYSAYFLAENMHVSGVLAVVAAGMIIGNLGPRNMSPTTRIVVANFWEFTAFVANSLVFLLIGLVVDPTLLLGNWVSIFYAILFVLLSRAVVIFGFSALTRNIPPRWQAILYWGGLRGAISLALALSLGGQPEIQAMAFGVVLFTLLVKGLSMGPLIRGLGLTVRSSAQDDYDRKQAMAIAARSGLEHLKELRDEGLVSLHTYEIISPVLKREEESLAAEISDLMMEDEFVAAEELDFAWREILRMQKNVYNDLLKNGLLAENQLTELTARIDAALTERRLEWKDSVEFRTSLSRSLQGNQDE